MGIITISRGSYSRGKLIAERLAERLGYECISRDILLEASEEFNVPEARLVRAIHDAPSFFDRLKHGKERYVAFIRKAFLEHIRRDDVIYHGLAGHFLAGRVPHIFKVRIIANLEDRVREEMEREGIGEKEARLTLTKDDEERRKWSLHLYGIDTRDPSLYDVVLHIDKLNAEDAVDILADAAARPGFRSTPGSRRALEEKYVGASAHAALIHRYPKAEVRAAGGVVHVTIETVLSQEKKATQEIRDLLRPVEGVEDVRVHVIPYGA